VKAVITANSTALFTSDIYVAAVNNDPSLASEKDWVVIGSDGDPTAGDAYMVDNLNSNSLPSWDGTGVAGSIYVMVKKPTCYYTGTGGNLIKASTFCVTPSGITNKLDDDSITPHTAHTCNKLCMNTPYCRYFALGKST
jgi:hypothetical protein